MTRKKEVLPAAQNSNASESASTCSEVELVHASTPNVWRVVACCKKEAQVQGVGSYTCRESACAQGASWIFPRRRAPPPNPRASEFKGTISKGQ